ncbi:RusA family crossover junction endodeoxyribonuclease [uncultured Culturomica sp.]|jgi:Holliday junction resolvase RusA-like endonuclease|uniref:RusA family crossover junction endodeoxyribonuclease n=1 Tax=uncultured Culturomica sp. TaxID=1926654 RepID=UPI00033D446B|nr:RusA family crossover junction endodeoxyribonuclease [uncultured Culturomica sp.]CCZ07398.1 unknown [Odoribacter sp. CAG:788]
MEETAKIVDLSGVKFWNKVSGNSYQVKILPFCYKGEKKKRLPRKSSRYYNLRHDVIKYFKVISEGVTKEISDDQGRYRVDIEVYKGKDTLGGADLDNYCKALLDGVTRCEKFWKDDSQVDEIYIKRIFCEAEESYIVLKISKI